MSKQTYHPDRGDLIHLNFAPSSGREFTGPHYALVISSRAFSRATGLCIALPATTKHHPDMRLMQTPLMVKLPPLAPLPREGWLYTHQIKTLDYRERGATFVAKLDDEFVIDVMERVRAFIDPDSAS